MVHLILWLVLVGSVFPMALASPNQARARSEYDRKHFWRAPKNQEDRGNYVGGLRNNENTNTDLQFENENENTANHFKKGARNAIHPWNEENGKRYKQLKTENWDTSFDYSNEGNDFEGLEESPSNAETAFVDFEDSTGIQGKQEMFDYGEDFDCGNETDTESACKKDEYACYSGKCIPRIYVCNEINDCGDLSDEQNCGCALDQFTCADGDCIPIQYKCNSYADCQDKSDEDVSMCKGCNSTTQFTCNTGKCIPIDQACDDKRDCPDGSDEASTCGLNTCDPTEFNCRNGNCIQMGQVCNGVNNCGDGSDEQECNCDADEFTCDNGKCIKKEYRCDTADNCRDGSDEHGCHCEAPLYVACKSSDRCISAAYKCNSQNDCGDWSDEKGCPCASHELACANGHCIDPADRCDGNNDCGDWSDEKNCGNCEADELTCANDNCVNKRYECDGDDNCGDASDEDPTKCGGCIWTEWQGEAMCSEPCGIGEQKYTRKQSPWGSKRASDCDQKESKMKECILSGCTATAADEAVEKTEDALRGIDEEIVYTMQYLYLEKTTKSDKEESCAQYAEMFKARKKLLKVSSGRGQALQSACALEQTDDGVTVRLDDVYRQGLESDNRYNLQTRPRVKRRANMGQALEQAVGKAMTRVKRRVQEIAKARSGILEEKANELATSKAKTGIIGVSEDLSVGLIQQDEQVAIGELKADVNAANEDDGKNHAELTEP